MLIRIIILPLFLLLSGFGGEYRDDNMSLPGDVELVEEYIQEKDEYVEEEKVVEKKKTFDDIRIKKSLCGTLHSPMKIALVKNNIPYSWQEKIIIKGGRSDIIKYNNYGMMHDLGIYLQDFMNGPNVSFVYYDTMKQMEKALRRGEVDMIIGMPYNPDQMLGIEYIYPAFFPMPMVAVTTSQSMSESINDYTELKGQKGVAFAAVEGLDDMIKGFATATKGINIVPTKASPTVIYRYLVEKKFKYIFTSLYGARTFQKSMDLEDKIFISDPIWTQQLFFAVSKNSKCRVYKSYFEGFAKQITLESLEFVFNKNMYEWEQQYKKSTSQEVK